MSATLGKVYLVGAGPGDPGLITVRGRECLERAHVVVYDSLANDALLQYALQAEHIFVGKSTQRHTLLQEEINCLLVDLARRFERVVRLKGGDPFVFGRGGEEALVLAEHGIAFEIVPGVTAGLAGPTYAGIPITLRGVSQSVTLLSGHDDLSRDDGIIDIEHIVTQGTLSFYMGVKNLPKISTELIRLGRSPDTPVAVISWGTYAKQRTIVSTLESVSQRCIDEIVQPPAIVVVGEVVRMCPKLSWFESRPLFGLRIVVTRSREQAGDFVHRLQELGADIFEFPTIRIEPVRDAQPFHPIGSYDWIIFTSVNGVEMLFERMEEVQLDARNLAGVKLCVIGATTADALRKRSLRIDLMPDKYVAEELLNSLLEREGSLDGKRFLLPRADIARGFLPKELRARGATVTELVAYKTVMPETDQELVQGLIAFAPDIVTFTSSSTALNFCRMMGESRLVELKKKAVFASIGPVTSETARDAGLDIHIEPEQHDVASLVAAITTWVEKNKPNI